MAEEPKKMLVEDWISSSQWIKKRSIKITICEQIALRDANLK